MLRALRLLLVGVAAAAAIAAGDGVADHTFPDLHGHDGRTTLAALRGRPVLFATWRPNTGESALPLAASLAAKHAASGLIVILASSDLDWSAARAYLQDRHGLTTAWTCANTLVPVDYEGPNESGRVAVLSADGRCLVAGIARALGSKVEDAVAEEITRRRAGHGDDPVAKKARALAFGKGRLGEAFAALGSATADEKPDRSAARAEIERDRANRIASIEFFRGRGEWTRARSLAKELTAAVAGNAEWEKEAAALAATFESPDARREIALAETVDKLAGGLRPGKASDAAAAKLETFAKEHHDSPVGTYAAETAALARALAER
jgi:hypothetical protein